MIDPDVYHAGEIAVQERTGDRAVAQRRGAMIADRLAEAARAFLVRQGVAAVGAAGSDGALWASLWCGHQGFLRSDELGKHVGIDALRDHTLAVDPVRAIAQAGEPLGMLVIDFVTRQRLRVNGIVTHVDPMGLELRVREAFGNCIKYIQRRQRSDGPSESANAPVVHGRVIDDERRILIARTDTMFVASIHRQRGLDVSHRGGHPGFIQVAGERTLRVPDYPGNGMYQTLGNFAVDARAGLALIDFGRRRVLSLTGEAEAIFGPEVPDHPSGGTGRYWSFTVDRWVEFSLPSTMSWTLSDRSPFNPGPLQF